MSASRRLSSRTPRPRRCPLCWWCVTSRCRSRRWSPSSTAWRALGRSAGPQATRTPVPGMR
ncbi:hypothetical protein ACFPRL_15485 [Pseudoclavibacter helvolus]